jgi:hypothetical protein
MGNKNTGTRSNCIDPGYFCPTAATREGSLQVEFGSKEYRLPRLTRAWTHLAGRLAGVEVVPAV